MLLVAPAWAAPDCATGTSGDDVCIITLNNAATETVDAGAQGPLGDKLQFGGAANFSFDVSRVGNGTNDKLKGFELFEKVGTNTVTLTGTATQQMNWSVKEGTLLATGSATGGGNILDFASVSVSLGATFGLVGASDNSETIAELNAVAGSFITLGGTGTLTTNNSVDTTIAGIISGTGNFTKGGGGLLHLTANNTYTGKTTVSGGILQIENAGAIDNSVGVTTNAGAQLTGIVAYTITGPVTNNGRIAGDVTINGNVSSNGGFLPGASAVPAGSPSGTPSNPGQSMGTITINGNYNSTGTGAFVGMFVDLDAALPANGTPGVTHDFFNVVGAASGTTHLFLAEFDNAADVGKVTVGNGIQLFRVTGATTAGAFVQGNSLTAGPYQYLLRYVADYAGGGGADGYFLQSFTRDEMIAQPAMLSAAQQLVRNCHRDEQRIPDSPKKATYGRAWLGYHQGSTSFGADTGIDMDLDFSCTTGGMDWRMGNGWFGGVIGGFGDANADLATPAGVGKLDGKSRVIEAYAAYTASSFFLNLSLGYSDMDWTYTGAISQPQTTSVGGFIAGAQAGAAVDLDFIAVKLIGALNFDDQNCGETCFGFGVNEDTGGMVEAKGTVRFDGISWGGSVRPWASISYSDVLSGGVNTVSLGAVRVSSDTNSELVSIDGGLQAYLDENFALFADGQYHESLATDISGYRAGLGVKLYW